MTARTGTAPKLTPKGRATRARLVETAAALIYEHGVRGTNNEMLRAAAHVSGSQLNHYFPDRESLLRAVITWRADTVIAFHQMPELGRLDNLATLQRWAETYLGREDIWRNGCSYGSLVSELVKSDLNVHDEIAAGFDRWSDLFRCGLRAMRDRGDLRPDANPDHLAHTLMAAFQGGMLLTQAAQNVTPLRDALDGALTYIASFSPRETRERKSP